jgi:hypothetical protein
MYFVLKVEGMQTKPWNSSSKEIKLKYFGRMEAYIFIFI